MKLGPYLLINLLMVAGGIFIYDSLKNDIAPLTQAPLDPLTAESAERPEAPQPSAPMIDGGANAMLQRDNAKRLNALETAFAQMRRELGRRGEGGETASPGVMPSLSSGDMADPENRVFDEDTLVAIAAYQDEINRRKNEERQKRRIDQELTRKNVELNEAQRQSIITETLAYQARARELMRKKFSRDEAGRTERRQAFEGLQDEYASAINRLVPEEQAEKILDSRLGRGMGFFGNFAGGGNASNLRRRNR